MPAVRPHAARCRCTCSSTCTAKAATAARRWSTCKRLREGRPARRRASELPDYLPLFLEFLSTQPPAEARDCSARPRISSRRIAERLQQARDRPTQSVFRRPGGARSAPSRSAEVVDALLNEPDPDPTTSRRSMPPGRRKRSRSAPAPAARLVRQGRARPPSCATPRRAGPERPAPSPPAVRSARMTRHLNHHRVRLVSLPLPDGVPARQPAALRPRAVHLADRLQPAAAPAAADVGLEPVPRRHPRHLRSAISSAC